MKKNIYYSYTFDNNNTNTSDLLYSPQSTCTWTLVTNHSIPESPRPASADQQSETRTVRCRNDFALASL